MNIVLWCIRAVILIVVMIIAAGVGMCLGAVFGIFMGPVKIIEWTSGSQAESSSMDRV